MQRATPRDLRSICRTNPQHRLRPGPLSSKDWPTPGRSTALVTVKHQKGAVSCTAHGAVNHMREYKMGGIRIDEVRHDIIFPGIRCKRRSDNPCFSCIHADAVSSRIK